MPFKTHLCSFKSSLYNKSDLFSIAQCPSCSFSYNKMSSKISKTIFQIKLSFREPQLHPHSLHRRGLKWKSHETTRLQILRIKYWILILPGNLKRNGTYQVHLPPGRCPPQHLHHSPLTRRWWCNLLQCWAGPSPPVAHGTPQYWPRSFSRWNPHLPSLAVTHTPV